MVPGHSRAAGTPHGFLKTMDNHEVKSGASFRKEVQLTQSLSLHSELTYPEMENSNVM